MHHLRHFICCTALALMTLGGAQAGNYTVNPVAAHAAIGTLELGGTTRFSFGPFLSKQDVKFVTDALYDIAASRIPASK